MTPREPSIVLYDEDCGFCKWSIGKILAWDRARRLRTLPIQSDEGARLLASVEPDRRLDSWHLISSGKLYSGGAAAAPLARLLPGGRPLAALLGAFPPATACAYTYIARRRDRWSRLLGIDERCELRR
jgi:predicted DCC family thiol-disulfide oxidoreductase YuxK